MRRDRQTEHKNTENGKRDGLRTSRDRRTENENRQTIHKNTEDRKRDGLRTGRDRRTQSENIQTDRAQEYRG